VPTSTFRYAPSNPPIIPSDRRIIWKPGVTYNGGIPTRNTIFTTLSPLSPAAGTTVTIDIATPGLVHMTNTFVGGERFTFQTTGALPTGISKNTNYYVSVTGLSGSSFQFCADNGSGSSSGTSVNTSGTQSGTQSIGLDDTAVIQNAINTCTSDQVVKLNTGVFRISVGGLRMRVSNITLRGSGPGSGTANFGINGVNTTLQSGLAGSYAVDVAATQLVKADRADTFGNQFGILSLGGDPSQLGTSINLTTDAVKDAFSCTLASAPSVSPGDLALIDINTSAVGCPQHPDVYWGPNNNAPNTPGGTRSYFCRLDRSLSQVMEVQSVVGNTVTFKTPFHVTYGTQYLAQFTPWDLANSGFATNTGVEDLFIWGGLNGQGNLIVGLASYCWVKNIDSCWANGPSVRFVNSYRCEVRDSFMHESPDVNPGGGGYLFSIDNGSADNLLENNIHWFGNKQIVMRASGGGNVIAYCYMDDSFGSNYPSLGEAGMNAGHMTTGHMELFEGNYTQNYNCDTYWGNQIYITVFRCWLTGLRAAAGPLRTYTSGVFPYKDFGDRDPANIQGFSKYNNVVGCVLGFNGQVLFNDPPSGETQTSFQYEQLTSLQGNEVNMWCFGKTQVAAGGVVFTPGTENGQLRQGNWDWFTQQQRWHGISGSGPNDNTRPFPIPASLYLTSKPAFWGYTQWPWIDPSTGATYTLPAKARFEIIAGLSPIPPGNQ